MKEGWKYSTIGELCTTINGLWKGKKKPFVYVGVIRNANFTKKFTLDFSNIEYLDVEERQYKTRKLQKGDLIVEKSGGSEKQPVGRAILFSEEDGEYSFSNFTSVLRIKGNNTVTPEFLYKYILHVYQRGDTRSMQKATTGIHNIEFDKYLAIKVPVPPLSEQQEIVTYLDGAFEKIDRLKENAEKAVEDAKALFQSALKEMMMPREGWEEKTLGEVCIKTNNIKWANSTESFKYIDLTAVDRDTAQIFSTEEINAATAPSRAKQIVIKGDVIFATTRPTLRRLTIIDDMHDGDICSTGFCVLRHSEEVLPQWIFFNLKSDKFYEYIEPLQTGANYPAVSDSIVKGYKIILPTIKEQHRIVTLLGTISKSVHTLEENYRKTVAECGAMKQALLKQIFE